jgi:hypothetical protein
MRTAATKIEQLFLQSIWHKVEYYLDACGAIRGAYFELAQRMKNIY